MRIIDSFSESATHPIRTSTPKAVASESDTSKPQAMSAPQDAVKVTVSAKARELAETPAAPDFDDAKVSRLRSAVEGGTFQIDSAKIAERIVEGD